MLGQAHTPTRRLFPFALLALLALAVLIVPAVGGAGPGPSQAELRARDARIVAASRSSVLSLYALDQQLGAAQARRLSLEAQARALRAQRVELGRELLIARSSTRSDANRLGERLRLLYEQGDVEPLEILFGASSLDEALTSIDSLTRASSQGQQILQQLKAARERLRTASLGLAARSAALQAALSEARATERSLVQIRASRTAYIAGLAAKRRLTEQQLAALVAQAQAAEKRSAAIVAAPAAVDQPALAPPSAASLDARTLTVTATGYSLSGATATGLPVGWGVAAVDPSVIPLGTHLSVPGYGEAVAADTGGAVVGATIDLWFPTTVQAMAWGRRTVTVTLH